MILILFTRVDTYDMCILRKTSFSLLFRINLLHSFFNNGKFLFIDPLHLITLCITIFVDICFNLFVCVGRESIIP